MTDVLKLAEEALERASTLLVATRDFIEANPVSEYTVFFDEAECDGGCLRHDVQTCNEWQVKQALTALRAARAEWDWRPIAEMERLETYEVACGAYTIAGEWVVTRFQTANAAIGLGYTHFYRPQLPPPPTREEVGNG
jgi:hypothetical protein